jgi:hypothetical protein
MDCKQAKTYLPVQQQQIIQDKLQELGGLLGEREASDLFVRMLAMSRQQIMEFRRNLEGILEAAEIHSGDKADKPSVAPMVFGCHSAYKDITVAG